MKLTKREIDATAPKSDKPYYLWEASLAGFGVKILPSGSKKYIVKYRAYCGGRSATQRWMTIGSTNQISLDQARKRAQQILAEVASGEDPQNVRFNLRQAPNISDLWQRFDAGELNQKKSATQRDYRSNWTGLLEPKFGNVLVRELTRSSIGRFHQSLSITPYRANRTLALLSKLMTLAEIWEWRDQGTNPCRYIKKYKEQSRERYLSQEELGSMGAAMSELVDEGAIWPDMARAISLLLLTGARKSEVLNLEWEWVSLNQNVILLPDSKTGKKPLYLSNAAVSLLELQRTESRHPEAKYVFPGRNGDKPLVNISKPWAAICELAGLKGIRIHDLRHTAASIAVGQGVGLPIIGRLLGHSQSQTTARYAHVDSDPALMAANLIGEVMEGAMQRKT